MEKHKKKILLFDSQVEIQQATGFGNKWRERPRQVFNKTKTMCLYVCLCQGRRKEGAQEGPRPPCPFSRGAEGSKSALL